MIGDQGFWWDGRQDWPTEEQEGFPMCEESFEETILVADTGSVFVRGGYGRKNVFLGISSERQTEGDPDIGIEITPRQQHRLSAIMEAYSGFFDRESRAMGVLSDMASQHCSQPGECGQTLPYCLSCRARDVLDNADHVDEWEHDFVGTGADCEECGEGRLHYAHQGDPEINSP